VDIVVVSEFGEDRRPAVDHFSGAPIGLSPAHIAKDLLWALAHRAWKRSRR
jgi:hypothetical protein